MRTKPPHDPTDKQRAEVEALASFGVSQDKISNYIGVSEPTLRKYYSNEILRGKMKAHSAVGKYLYKAATGAALEEGASHSDCIRAAIFWAKTQMGFVERTSIDHQSSDGSMTPKGLAYFYGERPDSGDSDDEDGDTDT